MFYPGVMDEIGEKLGGDFFVLPSSLHETIVVPDDGNMEYKALLAMVTEINESEVDKQDKLTDQVYHYDVTDKVFEKASRYEDREQKNPTKRNLFLKNWKKRKMKQKQRLVQRKRLIVKQLVYKIEDKAMNKAKNVERMTAYVKKVNAMVEKNKQHKK